MDVELYCTRCNRLVRKVSEGTTSIAIHIKNMYEAMTARCTHCGKVDQVEIRCRLSASTNDA